MTDAMQTVHAGQLPRIYLAGPDVFLPDPIAAGEQKKAICRQHGLEGVFPFDAEVDAGGRPRSETGLLISAANESLIRGCVAVIANMTPFRGPSADVGTAYEMGFARGLGLIVFAYTNDPTAFLPRTERYLGVHAKRDENGRLRDANDMEVEDWGLADNLMLEGGIHASGGMFAATGSPDAELFTDLRGFENCVRRASEVLKRKDGSA
ncbi:nucleoside 2-deoxyribosyltransferase [Fimbriiglobus ruber]|uniref:Nucleoside 2-deoxyribosyltransferase n=1 Tax=Fimbriiglobus ruber TaxID=1908690 RepID=A0A225DRC5_9BACT|nr:nucleoside 2-deoxyribosyltransferase [Fimbriiglobus ruber]OWK43643.1 Nucleoside 2-deoxyribosyltransferase [Fimbriiglobus ruber]